MELALISAFGVGGATIIGVIIGFFFRKVPHKFNDAILGFAAGIMLSAAILGLIIPSLEEGNVWVTAVGILAGAIFLNLADKLTPHLHHITGVDHETHADRQSNLNKVMLFVMAIAIHNLPEGIAAGVGFGSENISNAITVALGIALQNIPEAFDYGRCCQEKSLFYCLFYRRGGDCRNDDRIWSRFYCNSNFTFCFGVCRRNDALCCE